MKLIRDLIHDTKGKVDIETIVLIPITIFLIAILGGAALNYMFNQSLVNTSSWDPTVKLVVMTLVPVMAFLAIALIFIFMAIGYMHKGTEQ